MMADRLFRQLAKDAREFSLTVKNCESVRITAKDASLCAWYCAEEYAPVVHVKWQFDADHYRGGRGIISLKTTTLDVQHVQWYYQSTEPSTEEFISKWLLGRLMSYDNA